MSSLAILAPYKFTTDGQRSLKDIFSENLNDENSTMNHIKIWKRILQAEEIANALQPGTPTRFSRPRTLKAPTSEILPEPQLCGCGSSSRVL